MTDWRDKARDLIAAGMSINDVSREIGKSEFAIRFNLNINGRADRYIARHRVGKERRPTTTPTPPPLMTSRAITLPHVSISDVPSFDAPAPKIVTPAKARNEPPRVNQIRQIHQRMIRQGKLPGRDLLSEWRH